MIYHLSQVEDRLAKPLYFYLRQSTERQIQRKFKLSSPHDKQNFMKRSSLLRELKRPRPATEHLSVLAHQKSSLCPTHSQRHFNLNFS